ncbi:hypothetical protein GEMRC1_007934 [Eukaryota sp. GEM-RC1]
MSYRTSSSFLLLFSRFVLPRMASARLYSNIFLGCLSTLMFGYVLSSLNIPLLDNGKPGFIGDELPNLKDDTWKSIVTSSAVVGAMLSSMIASRFADKYGRRKTLLYTNIIFIAGAVICALSPDVLTLTIGRFVAGTAVGISSIVVPCFMSEISPPSLRGFSSVSTQMGVVFGILSGVIVGYFAASLNQGWRITVGFLAVPAFVQIIFSWVLVESPRWHAMVLGKKDEEECKAKMSRSLAVLRSKKREEVEDEVKQILQEVSQSQGGVVKRKLRFSSCRKPLMIAIIINMVQQLSGINAVIYYSAQIFKNSGLHGSEEKATILTMAVNVIATLFAAKLVDNLGRKTLLLFGLGGQIVSLFLLFAAPFFISVGSSEYFYVCVAGMTVYIASLCCWSGGCNVDCDFRDLS